MKGSALPVMPPQATWKAGSEVEVGWAIEAHHGGGYSYRLAPADAPLNEASFNKMPLEAVGPSIFRWALRSGKFCCSFRCSRFLDLARLLASIFIFFVGSSGRPSCALDVIGAMVSSQLLMVRMVGADNSWWDRWDGDKGTQLSFNSTRVTEGTFPKGSQWTKNPLPGPPLLWNREGPSFEPYCEETQVRSFVALLPIAAYRSGSVFQNGHVQPQDCKDTAHRWTRATPAQAKKGPFPNAGCAAALEKLCGKARNEAVQCNSCALQQWSALEAAGCTQAVEVEWCQPAPKPKAWNPPPGTCRCSGSPNVLAWLLVSYAPSYDPLPPFSLRSLQRQTLSLTPSWSSQPSLEIVDTLKIPADTKPGHYVLNWRWCVTHGLSCIADLHARRSPRRSDSFLQHCRDCEETAQWDRPPLSSPALPCLA